MGSDPLNTNPKKVALVALGTSAFDFVGHLVGNHLEDSFEEVWTVNMGLSAFRHHKLFVMDDLRVQAETMPAYGRALRGHDRPIITSAVYPEFPQSVRYPIEEVIKKIGDDYFANTVCYAIAYAMISGVKDLFLFGCDFFYPKLQDREEGGMNAGYLLGLARFFGMKYHLPRTTTLLGANWVVEVGGETYRPLYGYKTQPLFSTGGANDSGSQERTQLRATEGDSTSPIDQGKSLHKVDKRHTKGRKNNRHATASIYPGGQDIQRRRRGTRGNTKLGLADGEQVRPGGEGRMRTGIAESTNGPGLYLGPGGDNLSPEPEPDEAA